MTLPVARLALLLPGGTRLPAGHPLFDHPRVRLSAHISWSSPDSMLRTLELFVENLRRFRAGEPLEGIVDLAAGY